MFEDFTIEPDGNAFLISVAGAAQSRVVPDDPYDLSWGYLRHIAASVLHRRPEPLDIVHVGGGGMVLARYFAHTHPGSRQIVIEPNQAMTEAILERVPFPPAAQITLLHELGRAALGNLDTGSADLIVVDAYVGGHVPEDLTTVECITQLRRVLRGPGVLVYGLIDHPDMRYVARVCATVRAATTMAPTVMSPHHRFFGNHTVLCTDLRVRTEDMLAAVIAADPDYVLRSDSEIDLLCAAAEVLTDAAPAQSPNPPPETLGATW
ncbi:fused MFS/spermidine synthase [Nocardia sp. NPDC052001]|uniref:spermidine synthase n=1 Tax=Nocardia sp. NPDC052001 TaxID=3154853 RepID=UPI00342FCC0D